MTDQIRAAEALALAGQALSRSEILELLSSPLDSADDRLLRQAARRVALEKTGGGAYIWLSNAGLI